MPKKVKPKTVAEIPARQLKRFALGLIGTTYNVFSRAKLNWGVQLVAGDDLFDRIRDEAGVEKCENCDEWKATADMDKSIPTQCFECVGEMDLDDLDDE